MVISDTDYSEPRTAANGPNQFEIAVIVGGGEFAGITANSWADGELNDPGAPSGQQLRTPRTAAGGTPLVQAGLVSREETDRLIAQRTEFLASVPFIL